MGNYSFSNVPVIKYSRSRFDLSHGVKTSANVGTLYPFDIQEVYPGDTFKVKTACVSRLTSQFLRPVMDNLFLDTYHFFVPSRLLYDKFVNIFGENTESAWANTKEYKVPQVTGTVQPGTVGDYLGLPVNMSIKDVSVLPFRAFAKVYDEFFRDQNTVQPMHLQKGEKASSESFNNNAWGPNNYFGKLPKVAKLHDYFTSALPAPQKGSAVSAQLIGDIPVVTRELGVPDTYLSDTPLRFRTTSGSGGGAQPIPPNKFFSTGGSNGDLEYGSGVTGFSVEGAVLPSNLWADGSKSEPVTVNDLRYAFAYQKMLERDARSGSRYVEYLAAHFGVMAGDGRLQRAEFLGGKRSPISITQVTQTTGSDSDTAPLGQVGAFSLSGSKSRYVKGFVEHGFVVSVFCIRQFHTYQQGVERFWTRSKREQFYDRVFANIGEQPIYKTELYGSAGEDDVFGYGEAWADLRFRPNKVSGQMRSGITNSLDIWHFADKYSNAPTLTPSFIEETPQYVDRTITVESTSQDQFILDFYIQNIAYRSLPTYSVPSLIDHN